MTEAIFGLIGVVVGGLLQTLTQWHLERRREDWAARKAGRLLARSLARCRFILESAHQKDVVSWTIVAAEIEEALKRWPEHSDVLAGTVRQKDWNVISAAVDRLERIQQRGRDGQDDEIDSDGREVLGALAETVWSAALTSSTIGTIGTRSTARAAARRIKLRIARLPGDQWLLRAMESSSEMEGRTPPRKE